MLKPTRKQTKALHKSLLNQITKFKETLTQHIQTLPDNNLNKVTSNCFIIRSSQLSRELCLTPEYYNFRVQYNMIIEEINKSRIEKIEACFDRIQNDHRYHPTVKKHISDIWGKESEE